MDKRCKHGHANDSTYRTWMAMIQRCTNPARHNYRYYGGKGITVCEEWRTFPGFLRDMGERPQGMTIDRIDSAKGYEKSNCRWATRKEQARNKQNNRFVVVDGTKMCLAEACSRYGVNVGTAWTRLNNGSPMDEVFKRPVWRGFGDAIRAAVERDNRPWREVVAEYGVSRAYVNKVRRAYRNGMRATA